MSYLKVDFAKAKELLDTKSDLILFDVREEEEFITGHAKEAVLYTLSDINEESAKEMIPTKNIPIMLYCRSGRRSKEAADKLAALGYEEIYDIGSLIGWPYGMG